MTVSAYTYTLFRYKLPGLPPVLNRFSYGMMAPYQSYRTFNEELIAEGNNVDGSWERIDLNKYLPFIRGERAMRSYIISFRARGEEVFMQKYYEYAEMVLAMEKRGGKDYSAVRLSLEKWPMSPGGYEFLRAPAFITPTPLTQFP